MGKDPDDATSSPYCMYLWHALHEGLSSTTGPCKPPWSTGPDPIRLPGSCSALRWAYQFFLSRPIAVRDIDCGRVAGGWGQPATPVVLRWHRPTERRDGKGHRRDPNGVVCNGTCNGTAKANHGIPTWSECDRLRLATIRSVLNMRKYYMLKREGGSDATTTASTSTVGGLCWRMCISAPQALLHGCNYRYELDVATA